MDQILLYLIGKPKPNPGKVISVIVYGFSLLEDQEKFLRATLAIPEVKKLPIEQKNRVLIQIGSTPSHVLDQLTKENWQIHEYNLIDEKQPICERITQDLSSLEERSIIYINDISRLELLDDARNLLKLLLFLRCLQNDGLHFVILLYQAKGSDLITDPLPQDSRMIRNLEWLSNAFVRVRPCKVGYFNHIWFEPDIKSHQTLIPSPVETVYNTCKIGQFYWSSNLLCFHNKKRVSHNFKDDYSQESTSDEKSDEQDKPETDKPDTSTIQNLRLEEGEKDDVRNVRPYIAAQNPERSQIFYYPDKDDDFDEDDPDADLNI